MLWLQLYIYFTSLILSVSLDLQAQSATVAEIWLWQVGSWKAIGHLQCHSLTVTQIEFAHDDSFLLAVSRDSQFSVFSIQKSGDLVSYRLIAKQEAHKRIIWTCSGNSLGHLFATESRDKTVKLWTIEDNSVKQLATLPAFKESITALSWSARDSSCNNGLLAVGMDNGLTELWNLLGLNVAKDSSSSKLGFGIVLAVQLDPLLCHVATVNRLAWRKPDECGESRTLELASCGADQCVRVFRVRCRDNDIHR